MLGLNGAFFRVSPIFLSQFSPKFMTKCKFQESFFRAENLVNIDFLNKL